MEEEIQSFLDKACVFDECYQLTKYVMQRILGRHRSTDERSVETIKAASMLEICKQWRRIDLYEQCRKRFNRLSHKHRIHVDEDGLHQMNITFPMKRLRESASGTPKCILVKHCVDSRMKQPVYETVSPR